MPCPDFVAKLAGEPLAAGVHHYQQQAWDGTLPPEAVRLIGRRPRGGIGKGDSSLDAPVDGRDARRA